MYMTQEVAERSGYKGTPVKPPPQAYASASGPPRPQAQQPQASPYKAPDMSAYAQPSGGYNAYNVPRTAPRGAQQNDLSGNVPSNQIFAQAYNQASKQYGGNTQAQSFTMPGSFTSQGYNPTTGQYGPMTGGKSFDGNMAYNAIGSRPSPITATATGIGGNPMQWQDAMAQREAFAGNLSQRLNQYTGGQLTGPVTFDQGQLMSQANDQLAKGTFSNPFSQPQAAGNFSQQIPYGDSLIQTYGSQQNPDVQRAMGNATQYAQGNFQNPFGNSPQANIPQPSFGQQDAPTQPSAAQPRQTPSLGTSYNPSPTELPEPPPARPAPPVRYGWRVRPSRPAQEESPEPRAPKEAPPPPAKRAPVRAPQNMVIVPANRRGSSARLGGMRRNGG